MINTEAQLSLSSTGGSLLSKMAIQETNVEVTFVGWRCRTPKDPFPTDFCSGQKAIAIVIAKGLIKENLHITINARP